MPRPLRPIEEGLTYHVINRGNGHQDVFHKEADFEAFLNALGDLKKRKPFELYGGPAADHGSPKPTSINSSDPFF